MRAICNCRIKWANPSSSAQRDIQQNGQKAAVGTYDYRLTSGVNNDGLYIGYGLTQLELQATDSDALVLRL